MRRTALKRKSPLRRTRQRIAPRLANTDREAWKQPRWGRCENCGLVDDRPLHGHHVIARTVVLRAGGGEYAPANRMNLCERCHFNHEFGQVNRKIPIEKLPERALAFAVDLLGEDGAALYLRKRYACGEPAA